MQSMDGGGRSRGRKLKDRLARLLRPANSLLRSPCSSSSTSTFTATTAATTTISSSSSTTGAAVLPRVVEPFSAVLELLRHPPPRPEYKNNYSKQRCISSSHHCRRFTGVRKLSSNPYGFTTSDDGEGTDGDDEDGDDTEAFFSSRSLMSSDSSGFYTSKQQPRPKGGKNHPHHSRRQWQPTARRRRRRAAGVGSCVEQACSMREEEEGAAGFRPVVTTVSAEEEVQKGLAVVQRSRDPYGDFLESMAEMIVERQVFSAAELERLLRSYLSLNAPRLHPIILQAFSDIWVVLHGG